MTGPGMTDGIMELLNACVDSADGVVAEIGKRLGVDRTTVARRLERRRTFEFVDAVCEHLGLPAAAFYQAATRKQLTLGDAYRVLAFCHEPAPLDPRRRTKLLETLDERLEAWLAAGNEEEGIRHQQALLELDEKRKTEPGPTQVRLVTFIQRRLDEPATRGARADMALALAIWSTLRRTQGNRHAARDGYLAALRCLEGIPETEFLFGLILTKASRVLWDYDHLRLGLVFLDRALVAFAACSDTYRLGTVFYSCGLLHAALGNLGEAEYNYTAALRAFADHAALRFATLFELGDIQRRQGKLAAALSSFEAARKLENSADKLALAFLDWHLAKVYSERKSHREALELLRRALPAIREAGEPLDLALVIVDIATAAFLVGENLEGIGADFMRVASQLAPMKDAYRALVDLLVLLRVDRMTLADAEETRSVLEEAGRNRGPR